MGESGRVGCIRSRVLGPAERASWTDVAVLGGEWAR